MRKLVTLLIAIMIIIICAIPVSAHTFPADVRDWTKKDWKKWSEYQQQCEYYYKDGGYIELYYDDQRRIIWDEEAHEKWLKERKEWEDYEKKRRRKYDEDMRKYNEDLRRYYEANSCNYNYGYNYYSGYNYYGGIINSYDNSTEDQAIMMAKIIYLYAHGVSSQTKQACVGWAVMNSVDASGSNATVGTVASNFHYDSSVPTTDNFGRDLLPLARDIIFRWKAGKAGVTNNGRVLPSKFMYVTSDGVNIKFNTELGSGDTWDYSYGSPYGN